MDEFRVEIDGLGFPIPVFVLRLGSLVSLSALLLTITFSKRVRRHPVFTNFLCTWVIYSAYMTFSSMAQFAWPSLLEAIVEEYSDALVVKNEGNVKAAVDKIFEWFGGALQDSLWMITQVSTLTLVIHLWFTMKAAFRSESAHAEKWRTTTLVVTPYLSGALAVPDLFRFQGNWLEWAQIVQVIGLALVGFTFLWDILLLITFWRSRRILRRANIHDYMSISLLVKVLFFCLFRLALTISSIVADFPAVYLTTPTNFVVMASNIYPLLVFFLLGFQRDVLNVWLPCVGKRLKSGRCSDASAPDDVEEPQQIQRASEQTDGTDMVLDIVNKC